MRGLYILLALFIVAGTVLAGPTKDEHDKRTLNKDLSDVEHHEDDDDEHDVKYDHEAFLGKDDAKKFDDLSPAESKERLGKIVDKIDKDADGKVTNEELKNWISYISKRYLSQDSERQWKEHEPKADKMTWEEYVATSFGDDHKDPKAETSYKQMMVRDERRWKKADVDGDGVLTKEEFTDFLHPEEAPHMKDIVVQETLDDIDKNKDGSIDLEEYISDMWSPTEEEKVEPDWVKTERDTFSNTRDKNKDGKLGVDEIKAWIMPDDYDHVDAETKHLISQADSDNDGLLTRDEILNKYDVFVGSQATDFGEALTKHEEL